VNEARLFLVSDSGAIRSRPVPDTARYQPLLSIGLQQKGHEGNRPQGLACENTAEQPSVERPSKDAAGGDRMRSSTSSSVRRSITGYDFPEHAAEQYGRNLKAGREIQR
jgi:hypothetical protein